MKKAFTLIELLVVIAIIAILAAILFPVFAQAKLAAKKTVSISNQKQLGLSIIMYTDDYDDMYPRNDGCTLNDSMVTSFNNVAAGTNPFPYCNGPATQSGRYAFRDNAYNWGKYVMPYVKSVGLFTDPVIQPSTTGLAEGEIAGGYALNLAITGALSLNMSASGYVPLPNDPSDYQKFGNRVSWLGGATTSVPEPADAMLIMDQAIASVVGGYESGTTSNDFDLTYYPLAVKETFESIFYQLGGTKTSANPCGTQIGVLDNATVPYGTIPLSYCDGHTKAIPPGAFLANTPSAAQYGLTLNKYLCGPDTAAFYGNGTPVLTTGVYPMWGL
jgi:prepilin-type N-terminal cleavage/methylation domain-containing protein